MGDFGGLGNLGKTGVGLGILGQTFKKTRFGEDWGRFEKTREDLWVPGGGSKEVLGRLEETRRD